MKQYHLRHHHLSEKDRSASAILGSISCSALSESRAKRKRARRPASCTPDSRTVLAGTEGKQAETAMTETIEEILARHGERRPRGRRRSRRPTRGSGHADPALFIALRPKSDALAAARSGSRPRARRASRSIGVPFAVKDNIDVAGLPTTAACPAFAYTAGSARPSSSRGSSGRRDRRSARPISTSSRPASSACARPMAFRATRCAPISFPAARARARRPRSAPGSCRSRSAPTRPARAACPPRSTASSA